MRFAESAIYRHFSGKDEIIVAMLTHLANETDKIYSSSINKADGPEEKFRALFRAQFKFFNENPFFAVAIFSDGLMHASEKVNEAIINIMGVKRKHLEPIVKHGQQKKVFTDTITQDELVHVVMGSFRLLMFKWRVSNFEFDIKRKGDKMIEVLLHLIRK